MGIAVKYCSVDGLPRTAPLRHTFRLEGAVTCTRACLRSYYPHEVLSQPQISYVCFLRTWDMTIGRDTSSFPVPGHSQLGKDQAMFG